LDIDPRVEAVVRSADGSWLQFTHPSRIVQTGDAGRVGYIISTVEELTRTGSSWAVGFVTFEAGAAYGLCVHDPLDLPLAWFAIFEESPVRFQDLSEWCAGTGGPPPQLGPMRPTLTAEGFERGFDRIKEHIASGNTYQANYTFRLDGLFSGDPRQLFAHLVRSQRGQYSAFIRTGDLAICSASPELFFRRSGRHLTARPMKGTSPRGRTLAEDHSLRDRLRSSPKERAENVMIVDMMRNDIGRVAAVGSVSVPELFAVERYPTVWQMTSRVSAETDATLAELFAALHPSASVTGAPKVRTMEILAGLEPGPRGIYTGAIGYVSPAGEAQFNVAIRTALLDERRGRVSFGVGSGIVWDSSASAEYEECLLKGAVLGRAVPDFELLETLRWTPAEGFYLLGRHLRRLSESAEYFQFEYDERRVNDELSRSVAGATAPLRVRLLMSPLGAARVECTLLHAPNGPARFRLADAPVSRNDVFLYHKTTNRAIYDRARKGGADDVCLWNEDGEITESTIANIVVELDGCRVTPPVDCGLLAGTFRGELLERGDITERVVLRDELRRADRIWLINSVQGWRPAALAG
jgi:para-aminobenzoate synthetase/4-amino-4-deoxychorismate lyase